MKKQLPERKRREATTRQRSESNDQGETYERIVQRVDTIDGTGGSESRGSSYDGSDGGYVGAMLIG